MTRHVLIACLLLLLGGLPAAADCPGRDIEGVWSPVGQPTQIGPLCAVTYVCGPEQTSMGDASCKTVADRETVTGACSADGGPVDSCNKCLTNPPNKTCHYKHVDQ
jgi:hypothetical protein